MKSKLNIGVLNIAGKEYLEQLAALTGKEFMFEPKTITKYGIVISWVAYELKEEQSLVGAGECYVNGSYQGD